MEASVPGRLAGSEIHGFRTMEELDVGSIKEEAGTRWLRPNEIHAILFNRNVFSVNVKPVNLPKSGAIVLFDRKMLRNFRKDGHNWKKKKDGKTVKEAHEHLKVGNEERIHVYYAHGQDNPNFVRRCYWLLDKSLEHIVLVHYRETQELQGSPSTPVNSNSSSGLSDPSGPWLLSEETDSSTHIAYSAEHGDTTTHEKRLHDINTLEWDELLITNDPNISATYSQANDSLYARQNHYDISGSKNNGNPLSANESPGVISCYVNPHVQIDGGLQTQDSFGRWMNYITSDSPGSVDDPLLEYPVSVGHESFASPVEEEHISSGSDQIFSITDVSPSWAFSTEETKVIVIGYFHEEHSHLARSNLFCVCGDVSFPADVIQIGVYRCFVPPHTLGIIGMYLSIDGNKPISQVVPFEYRTPLLKNPSFPSEDNENFRWEEFRVQMRLAHLLFSSSKCLNILSSKVSQSTLKEAKKFQVKTSPIAKGWAYLMKSIENNHITYPEAKDSLFVLALRDSLREWLLERVVEGRKTPDHDDQGQGVIHLCAILDYTWAVPLYSYSGLSVDYRDKYGWTALHWAAYCGREKMVAALLFAGAKASLVTDPTPENPGGFTAADLASSKGHDGLAAFLAEKGLVEHFKAMTIAGNVSGSLQINTTEPVNTENLSEDELNLKDTLAAYRTAADAAARIQAALNEHSLKLRTSAIEISNPETEARNIIAAMKIQHAYRNHETRKKMAAAAQIQHRFRTWKIRRDFINMRRQTVKIQAIFRGFQVRRQYRKIIWSVGVLEKAILRWRLKRKGFRGLQVEPVEAVVDQKHESDTEEDFFRASRKQAEERVERSVVRVQAMFRSKQAQQEYRRIKLAQNQAMLEFEEFLDPGTEME